MTIEEIQTICKKFKGVTEDIKWENHLCFNIGNKMFVITAPDEVPPTASIKVSEDAFDELCLREGFMAAPYLARYKWIRLQDISLWNTKQWEFYARQAYELVAAKLPLKTRIELGLVASDPKSLPKQRKK